MWAGEHLETYHVNSSYIKLQFKLQFKLSNKWKE